MTVEQSKVVYLDIDGVLNSLRCLEHILLLDEGNAPQSEYERDYLFFENQEGSFISRKILNSLRSIVYNYGVQVVIISSWFDGNNEKEIGKFLNVPIHPVKFEYCGGGSDRAKYVLKHIQENNITSYVILDDEDNGYTDIPELQEHFIHIDDRIGIDVSVVMESIEILGVLFA